MVWIVMVIVNIVVRVRIVFVIYVWIKVLWVDIYIFDLFVLIILVINFEGSRYVIINYFIVLKECIVFIVMFVVVFYV